MEISAPQIDYVLSIIDYKDRPDDKTLTKIQPRENSMVDIEKIMRLNMKDSVNIKFYEWFPSTYTEYRQLYILTWSQKSASSFMKVEYMVVFWFIAEKECPDLSLQLRLI